MELVKVRQLVLRGTYSSIFVDIRTISAILQNCQSMLVIVSSVCVCVWCVFGPVFFSVNHHLQLGRMDGDVI